MKRGSYIVAMLFPVGLLLLGCGRAARAQTADADDRVAEFARIDAADFAIRLDAVAAAEIDGLVYDLGSPDYRTREAASMRLVELGARAFAKLRGAYRATDDLEVRIRVETIAHQAYLNRHIHNKVGYLGISRAQFPTHADDPRIPKGQIGITLGKVLKDTAAARAKLQIKDIIMAVDGHPLEIGDGGSDQVFKSFAKTIRDRGPGGILRLTILRGEKQLDIDVTLGGAPRKNFRNITELPKIHRQVSANFHIWWADHFRNPPSRETAPDQE